MKSNLRRFIGAAVLIALGFVSVISPSPTRGNPGGGVQVSRLIIGTVAAASGTSVTVTSVGSGTAIIALTPQTMIVRGSVKHGPLVAGDRVIVLASVAGDGSMTALRITATPVKAVKAKKISASGTIRSVGAAGVTVVDRKGGILMVVVDSGTRLELDGHAAMLGDFATGDSALLLYTSSGGVDTAVQIVAKSLKLRKLAAAGTVAALNQATDGTLKDLDVTLKDGADLALAVTPITQITDAAGNPVDLSVGDSVDVQYVGTDADGYTAIGIRIRSPASGGTGTPKLKSVTGAATAVNATSTDLQSITVKPTNGADPVTFQVTSMTQIEVNGQTADLTSIVVSPPSPVHVTYHVLNGTLVADKIVVAKVTGEPSKKETGTIEAVDAASNTIKIKLSDGFLETIHLNGATKVTLDGSAAAISDLAVGQKVSAQLETDSSGAEVATGITATTPKKPKKGSAGTPAGGG